MPVLHNSRFELYCQYVVAGDDGKTSATRAGFRSTGAGTQSTKLLKLPEIQKRIKELKERNDRKLQSLVMSEMERKVRLSEFASSNLVDFLDESGDIKIDKNQKGIGALSEYAVKRRTIPGELPIEEVTKTIKLRDPIASIDLLNKMTHVYAEQPPVNQDNRVLNIFVVDNEAKDLISKVKERTQKLIEG